jgi:DNA polymerase (family 10)
MPILLFKDKKVAEPASDILQKARSCRAFFVSVAGRDHTLGALGRIVVLVMIQNGEIAEYFTKVADFLEIEGANPFRVRAYRNAARTITGLANSITELIAAESDLTQLSGIGKELSEKIREIVRTGRLAKLEELENRLPPGLHHVLKIPGLGPRKVKALYHALKIKGLEDLKKAAQEGRVRTIEGFGQKTEEKILKDIQRLIQSEKRTSWFTAEAIARPLTDYLQQDHRLADITTAGSFRRRKETVGDLDILISCRNASAVMNSFTAYEGVESVISKGDTRSSIVLRSGLQVDLRVVPQESYGAALHYFTGSQAHNIAIRRIGRQKGLKINEYGVFSGSRRMGGRTEEEVYASLDLPYIEPELREDCGEIQAAREGRLPHLVALTDIRGDLHCHTTDSDGRNSLEEMAKAAAARGYAYLAITNHTQHLKIARGLSPAAVKQLIAAIDRLNARSQRGVVLKSMEVDILRDGKLDLPDQILSELDFTVCSIHSDFQLDRDRQTERILRAMDNPHFNILGHPTGRLLDQRPAYAVDLERVITAAAERGCFLELNAHPDRLDLDDVHCRLAKETGVKVAISTDAHSVDHLDYMRLGVAQARRGWLEPSDVLNTHTLSQLQKLFRRF